MSASRSVPNGVSGLLPVTTFGWLGGRGQSGAVPAALAGAERYAAREAGVRDARAAPAMVTSPKARRTHALCQECRPFGGAPRAAGGSPNRSGGASRAGCCCLGRPQVASSVFPL